MQVCISLQTDNHDSTPPLSFFAGRMPFLLPNQQRQCTQHERLELNANAHRVSITTALLTAAGVYTRSASMRIETATVGYCKSINQKSKLYGVFERQNNVANEAGIIFKNYSELHFVLSFL